MIRRELELDTELMEGSRGVFDVLVDGRAVFSKHASHRFPDPDEIIAALRSRQGL